MVWITFDEWKKSTFQMPATNQLRHNRHQINVKYIGIYEKNWFLIALLMYVKRIIERKKVINICRLKSGFFYIFFLLKLVLFASQTWLNGMTRAMPPVKVEYFWLFSHAQLCAQELIERPDYLLNHERKHNFFKLKLIENMMKPDCCEALEFFSNLPALEWAFFEFKVIDMHLGT